MPWFKIDDSAYSHPKFIKAGNAALGLWLRCGAYSAQHLLEGHVPGIIAKAFGTDPQIRKLIAAGLWHAAGHNCTRCPEPEAGGYIIHDFFEGGRNPTRAQVDAARRAAADRQSKARATANETQLQSKQRANHVAFGGDSEANESRNEPQFPEGTAGQAGESRRDGVNGVTPSQASPHHTAVLPSGSTACLQAAGGDALADLKGAVAAAGLTGISWNLQADQTERVRQVVDRVGVSPMVVMAVRNAQLKGMPASASAWITDWGTLAAAPQPQPGLPAAAGAANILPFTPGQRPSTSNQRSQQAIDTGRRLQAMHDAQSNSERESS